MIEINKPEDILGLGIANILQYRIEEPSFQKLITNWNKTIVIVFKDIYAVSVFFQGEKIRIEYDECKKYDLKLILDINVMVELAEGTEGVIRGFIKGKIKVKKLWNIGVLLKFIRIFIPNLKIAGNTAEDYKKGDKF